MIKPAPSHSARATVPPGSRSGGARLPILAIVFFLLGGVLTGIWFKYGNHATGSILSGQGLSGGTLALLQRLNAPVEIRFYSVLPAGSAPETLQAFSARVDHLLSEFQSANEAKIHVTRNLPAAGSDADAATADGIQPFNLEKGDACFLGLTVVCGKQKESLPRLQPEWEPALEFDLVRAIAQVTATPASSAVKAAVPFSPEVTNEVVRLIPNLKGTSLEEGTRHIAGGGL